MNKFNPINENSKLTISRIDSDDNKDLTHSGTRKVLQILPFNEEWVLIEYLTKEDNASPLPEMPGNIELIDQIETMNNFISELRVTLFKMFEADAKAGCAFYNDGTWCNNYLKLQKMINCKYATCVYAPKDDTFGSYKYTHIKINWTYPMYHITDNEGKGIGTIVTNKSSTWSLEENKEFSITANERMEIIKYLEYLNK